jgi:hypothetical protein
MNIDAVQQAIARGLAFCSTRQLPHGEFTTLIGSDLDLSDGVWDSSVFVTATVLSSLEFVGGAAVPLIDRGLDFLESEREPGGLWRYYSSRQFKHTRIPPDLDDTCCVSLVLRRHGRPVPRNRRYILANRDADGRFGTWMIPTAHTGMLFRVTRAIGDWRAARRKPPMPEKHRRSERFRNPTDPVAPGEIDPVVNANVIAYLGDAPDTTRAIDYVNQAIVKGGDAIRSFYYPNSLALYYAVARAFRLGVTRFTEARQVCIDASRRQIEAHASPLTIALGVAVLLSFDPTSTAVPLGVNQLLASQRDDGSWPRETFYRGYAEFWGSEELTTGFCLEALARFAVRT